MPQAEAPLQGGDDGDGQAVMHEWVVSDAKDVLFGHIVPDDLVNDPTRFVRQGTRGFVSWKGTSHLVEQRERAAKSDKSVWVISDPNDALAGQTVPDEIISDEQRFVRMGGRGLVRWKGVSHLVELRDPKQVNGAPWADVIMKKYKASRFGGRAAYWSPPSALSNVAALVVVASLAALVVVGVRRARRQIVEWRGENFSGHHIDAQSGGVPLLCRTVSDEDVILSMDDAL